MVKKDGWMPAPGMNVLLSNSVDSVLITGFAGGHPFSSARQHLSYGDCLEVKRGVLDCVTQCSQSAAHLCEQCLQVKQIGFVTLGPLHCA